MIHFRERNATRWSRYKREFSPQGYFQLAPLSFPEVFVVPLSLNINLSVPKDPHVTTWYRNLVQQRGGLEKWLFWVGLLGWSPWGCILGPF